MRSVRPAILAAFSVIAIFAVSSAAADTQGGPFMGFGASANGSGGTDYVRFSPVEPIAPIAHGLVAGAFGEGNFATEFAIDDTGALVSVNTRTGAVATIGSLGLALGPRVALAVDPITTLMLVANTDVACDTTAFYTVDRTTGLATLVTMLQPCYQSMVFDSAGNLYLLDRDTEAIGIFDAGSPHELGPLGVPIDDSATLAIDPANDFLYLVQFVEGDNHVYFIDTTTGSALLLSQTLGGTAPVSALAFALPLPDTIFADGFD